MRLRVLAASGGRLQGDVALAGAVLLDQGQVADFVLCEEFADGIALVALQLENFSHFLVHSQSGEEKKIILAPTIIIWFLPP